MKLRPNDQRLLNAAEGWLELGNWQEANEELERITPEMRAHPFVLRVRWGIYAKAEKWEMAAEVARSMTMMLPDNSWGYIQLAYSLRELKQIKEAWEILIPIADKFPEDSTISYNLACYACQLGNRKEAFQWLGRRLTFRVKRKSGS